MYRMLHQPVIFPLLRMIPRRSPLLLSLVLVCVLSVPEALRAQTPIPATHPGLDALPPPPADARPVQAPPLTQTSQKLHPRSLRPDSLRSDSLHPTLPRPVFQPEVGVRAASPVVLRSPEPVSTESRIGIRHPDPQVRPSGVRWGRFAAVTGGMAVGYTSLFLYEKSRWWDGPGSGFHFDSHLDYARNVDKISHFYAGEVQALINARLLEWSGVPHERAALWGAVTSLAAQTHVEVHDGFSQKWGFDWYDQAANTLGAAWFYAHDRVPALRRFDVRWSYYPSDVWLENLSERQAEGTTFADDYSGHAYWLSMDVHDLLPGALQQVWPEALQVSLGASLHDWTDDSWSNWEQEGGPGPDPDAYMAYYVSLDLNWRKILPRSTWLGRTAGDLFNRFHLPFPAVRVWPEPGVHLIFVGQE